MDYCRGKLGTPRPPFSEASQKRASSVRLFPPPCMRGYHNGVLGWEALTRGDGKRKHLSQRGTTSAASPSKLVKVVVCRLLRLHTHTRAGTQRRGHAPGLLPPPLKRGRGNGCQSWGARHGQAAKTVRLIRPEVRTRVSVPT